MFTGLFSGFIDFFRSFSYLSKHRLWKYAVLLGLVMIVLTALAFYGFTDLGDVIGDKVESIYTFDKGRSLVGKITDIISSSILIIGFVLILKYIIIIIAGPFMSHLSERIEKNELGGSAASMGSMTVADTIKGIARGIRLALRNFVREMVLSAVLLILGLFPFFTPISVVGLILVQAYYIGFGHFDFFLERYADVRQSISIIKKDWAYATGNGLGFLVLFFIPVIGWVLAPVLGTVAATRHMISKGEYTALT